MGKQFICLEAPSVSALRFQLLSKINLLPLVHDVCLLIFVILYTSAILANFNLNLILKSYYFGKFNNSICATLFMCWIYKLDFSIG
jgi:hypothetical protein